MKSKRNKTRWPGTLAVCAIIIIGIVVGFQLFTDHGPLDGNDNQTSKEELAKQQAREEAGEQGLLILVNKQHPVDQVYRPDDLMAMSHYASDRSEAGRYMRAEAVSAFNSLVEQAALDGIELKMTTAYRSYGFQKILYDNYVAQYGEEEAGKFSAKPGESEHQTGLAVDVSSPSVNYQLTRDFGDTEEGRWLATHAHEFGFILRYPEGKENITGYMYEPWHLRYVGKFVAKEIYQEETTLEEYLQKYLAD